jgi:uncharacterized membrane protein
MAYPGSTGSRTVRFEVIGEAWRLFSANMANWVISLLVMLIVIGAVYVIGMLILFPMLGLGAMMGMAGGEGAAAAGSLIGMMIGILLMMVLMAAVYGFLGAGLFRMAVSEVRGRKAQVGDLFAATDVIVPMILAAVLIGILTTIGSWLCIIPAFIVGGMTMLTYPLIVDQKMGVVDALTTSFNTLKRDILMATLLYLVLIILAAVGGMLCGIGALFTTPLIFLSIALVYRDFFPEQFAATGPLDPMAPPPAGPPPAAPPPAGPSQP